MEVVLPLSNFLKQKAGNMTDLKHLLEGGGKVLIFAGRDANVHGDWRADHRVIVWDDGGGSGGTERDTIATIPKDVRAVLSLRFISHATFGHLQKQAKDRSIPMFPMLSTGELKVQLARFGIGAIEAESGRTISPKTLQIAEKGAVKALVHENVDWTQPSADEARRLLKLAEERGIPTTFASIVQRINKDKQAKGLSATPSSVRTKMQSKMDILLKTLDDSIAGLQLVRDTVRQLEDENADLKTKISGIEKLLGRSL